MDFLQLSQKSSILVPIYLSYGSNCILQVISSKVLNHILAAIFALI